MERLRYTRINNLHTKTSLKCIQLINASDGYRICHLAVTVLNSAGLKYVKVKKNLIKKNKSFRISVDRI